MKDIQFNITQESINLGVAKNSHHCIIAESLKAAYPQFKFVSVDVATIRATDPTTGLRHVWLTPRPLQKIIVSVDQGDKASIKPLSNVRLQRGMEIASGRANTGHRPGKKTKKAVLVKRGHRPPLVRGGKAPPKVMGARREFGLRGFG